MISVLATLVFVILLLHALYDGEPAKPIGYGNQKVIIIPARLLKARGLDINKITVKKPPQSKSNVTPLH